MTGVVEEIPLSGGRTATGIVRIGETVRRPAAHNSRFVCDLLWHLEADGFEAAPRCLGTDEQGRDILSYIEGEVPADLGWYDDGALIAAAHLIRRFHDATLSFLDPATAAAADLPVICHNDLSPCNFVFRAGLPVAIIDFDAAAPGSRYDDLGYAAWLWLDIGAPETAAAEQRRRLRLFLDAYGLELIMPSVIEAILAQQQRLIDEGRRSGRASMARWAERCLHWTTSNLASA